jgi:hypothetical protein
MDLIELHQLHPLVPYNSLNQFQQIFVKKQTQITQMLNDAANEIITSKKLDIPLLSMSSNDNFIQETNNKIKEIVSSLLFGTNENKEVEVNKPVTKQNKENISNNKQIFKLSTEKNEQNTYLPVFNETYKKLPSQKQKVILQWQRNNKNEENSTQMPHDFGTRKKKPKQRHSISVIQNVDKKHTNTKVTTAKVNTKNKKRLTLASIKAKDKTKITKNKQTKKSRQQQAKEKSILRMRKARKLKKIKLN